MTRITHEILEAAERELSKGDEPVIIAGTIWRFATLADGGARLTIELDVPNTQLYRRQFPEVARVAVAPLKDDAE